MPEVPRTKLANLLCSRFLLTVCRGLIAKHGRVPGEPPTDQWCTIVGQSGLAPNIVRDTFHRLLNREEIIFGEKLSSAKRQHVGVHAAALQIGPQITYPPLGFGQRRHAIHAAERARFVDDQPRKRAR